ncbi:hypothetical protein ACFWZT_27730 [Streptomyces alboflavus]|uniref:hypothetical protein n=1 Tax=Streptomyces alboflavus TaxID=67267 RepID=UPI0036CE693E
MVTGIATYYSARTAEDQLKQSQEDTDESIRAQASKVAFYSDVENNSSSRHYYLVNRSADPISRMHVMISSDVERKKKGTEPRRQKSQLILWIGSVPPCSRVVLQSRNMAFDPKAKANRKIPHGTVITLDQYFTIDSIFFNDSGGRRWKRTLDELTHWMRPADEFRAPSRPVTDVSIVQVRLAKSQKVLLEPLKPCGGV